MNRTRNEAVALLGVSETYELGAAERHVAPPLWSSNHKEETPFDPFAYSTDWLWSWGVMYEFTYLDTCRRQDADVKF